MISDTNKSGSINKRVRKNGTLFNEVYNIKFVINRNGDKTITSSSKSTKSFFRTDPNYGPKSYDKSNKVLPLSQNQNYLNLSQEQRAKWKRSFKTSRGLNQYTCMQRKTGNQSKSNLDNIRDCLSHYKCHCQRWEYLECR